MCKEIPLRIFIRNTFILGLFFVIISGVIIEKKRQQNGESSLFNNTFYLQNNNTNYNYNDSDKNNSYSTSSFKGESENANYIIVLSYFALPDAMYTNASNSINQFSREDYR